MEKMAAMEFPGRKLEHLGYPTEELKKHEGFQWASPKELFLNESYTKETFEKEGIKNACHELKKAGVQLHQLINKGKFDLKDLYAAGFTLDQLKKKYNCQKMYQAKIPIDKIRELSHHEFSASSLKKAGATVSELRAGGFLSEKTSTLQHGHTFFSLSHCARHGAW